MHVNPYAVLTGCVIGLALFGLVVLLSGCAMTEEEQRIAWINECTDLGIRGGPEMVHCMMTKRLLAQQQLSLIHI